MAGDHSSRFAQTLRRFRLMAGISQHALAERAGLSERGVSNLERGLRTSPRPETVRMLADALALSPEDRAALTAAAHPELNGHEAMEPAAPDPARSPLAPPPTPLIGRDQDVARIEALLGRKEVRMVTLTGPGGVGKTRLALAAASRLRGSACFGDSVAIVELAPVRDPALVTSAIASALGILDHSGRSLADTVREAIHDRPLLLVLDNFEQVAPAAVLVADLLAGCPTLAALVTSRERLHLRGEHEVPVAPLALPAEGADGCMPLATLATVPAVRLFVERAQEADIDFSLTVDNAATIAGICRQLDGLPLAIELATARLKVLSPEDLLERLPHRLQVLRDGPRDLPQRQQTLRDTIAWSYDLLTPVERRLFRATAVFSGGFTLAAFEEVCGPLTGPDMEGLDALGSLVDKSLVRKVGGAAPRYLMLETIREFAEEQLIASEDEALVRQRHADWCLTFASEALPAFRGVPRPEEVVRLHEEHPNLRAALSWMSGADTSDGFLKLAAELGFFWYLTAQEREGLLWLQRALAMHDDETAPEYVEALIRAGHLAHALRDARAAEYLSAARALAQASGDASQEGHATLLLGIVAEDTGDYARAYELLSSAREIAGRDGYRWGQALADYHLGVVAFGQGDIEHARATLEATHAMAVTIDDTLIRVWSSAWLALVECEQNHVARSASHMRRVLTTGILPSFQVWPPVIGAAALLAAALGDHASATRLLGATAATIHDLPFAFPERIAFMRAAQSARQELGDEAYTEAWSAGRQMPIEAIRVEIDRLATIAETADGPAARLR